MAEDREGMGEVGARGPIRHGAARDRANGRCAFQYVAYRRERAREKTQLREELKQLERPPLLRPLPEKTLWELWRVYGFEDRRFPEAVCVELASAWIDRLYGPETTRAVDLGNGWSG